MAQTLKYTLDDFKNIRFNGFDFVLPEDTITLISNLSLEVGSPTYVKTPIFQKRDPTKIPQNDLLNGKNKRKTKSREVMNDDDWETIRNFQSTKLEMKEGVEIKINLMQRADKGENVVLKNGDIVGRHLQDGDIVFFNRQIRVTR